MSFVGNLAGGITTKVPVVVGGREETVNTAIQILELIWNVLVYADLTMSNIII